MALQYPPEWKFDEDDDANVVPSALRDEAFKLIEKIARGAARGEEQVVVEAFKSRFGNANGSSSLSWAYDDLRAAMTSMKNGAEFAEAFWLGVEDAKEHECVVPKLEQVNKLYARHMFPFTIDPPHLVRTDDLIAATLPDLNPAKIKANPTPPAPDRGLRPTLTPPATPPTRPNPGPPKHRPSVFIASSKEGLPLAQAVQMELDHDAETTIWTQGVFRPNDRTVDALLRQAGTTGFGVFVLSADDVVTIRNKAVTTARDNVVFELGLFFGALGVERCFLLRPRDEELHLPTDLIGVNPVTYARRQTDANLRGAVGAACSEIRLAIGRVGSGAPLAPAEPGRASISKSAKDLGLDEVTIATLTSILASVGGVGGHASGFAITEEMRKRGFAPTGVAVGTRILRRLGLIEQDAAVDDFGNEYPVWRLTDDGEEFVIEHRHLFDTRHPTAGKPAKYNPDDDIPF